MMSREVDISSWRVLRQFPLSNPEKSWPIQRRGGDDWPILVNSFTKAVARQDPSLIRSGPAASLASHMMVFRAEQGRRENKVVTL